MLFFVLTRLVGPPDAAVKKASGQVRQNIPYGKILKGKNLWYLSIASMFFSGLTYLTVWLPTYLDWRDPSVYTTDFCATVMTAYSLGMLISRTGLAALSEKISTATYVKSVSYTHLLHQRRL